MTALLRPALVLLALFTALLGLAVPLAFTGIAQLLFPAEANGSLVLHQGRVAGSSLLAQGFTADRYFHPRPSAAGAGYDATASSGSNLGPTSAKLLEAIRARAANTPQGVPADAATASGSGLDPHVSPANARAQAARVATARGLPAAQVLALVEAHTEGRTLGILGEPRVNVLLLNLALDGGG